MVLDQRYRIIKLKFEDGKIRRFADILDVVPKSRLARDLKKNNARMDMIIAQVDLLKVEDLAKIGRFCELSLEEMFKIVEVDCKMEKLKIHDRRYKDIDLMFRRG